MIPITNAKMWILGAYEMRPYAVVQIMGIFFLMTSFCYFLLCLRDSRHNWLGVSLAYYCLNILYLS